MVRFGIRLVIVLLSPFFRSFTFSYFMSTSIFVFSVECVKLSPVIRCVRDYYSNSLKYVDLLAQLLKPNLFFHIYFTYTAYMFMP